VLGEVVEGHAQLAPVRQLEREVVEVGVALAHERRRVVVGVDVQPGALVAEAVGHLMPRTSQ
jgi:hypothetical protein